MNELFAESILSVMIPSKISESVLAMNEQDRLELARTLMASVGASTEEAPPEVLAVGIRRIEDIVAGSTAGLSEEEFRRALQ